MLFHRSLGRFIDMLVKIEKYFSVSCLSAMLVLGTIQIIMRTFIGRSFIWIYPMTLLLFCFMIFIGMAVVFKHKEYIVVDALVRMFPLKYQKRLKVFVDLLIVTFFIFLLSHAPKIISMQNIKMQIIHIPRYVQTLPLFIASVTIVLVLVHEIIGNLFIRDIIK